VSRVSDPVLDPVLGRLRSLCSLLPEVTEVGAPGDFGRPTFRVAVRAFAAYERDGDRATVIVKLPRDVQAVRLGLPGCEAEEETGAHGWTVVDTAVVAWEQLDELVVAAYRLVAPPAYVLQLDARLGD
jgi:hypothetical protein